MSRRPSVPDGVADPSLAHVAALRDRLAELQRRIDRLLDELEAGPRSPDGQRMIVDDAARAVFAKLMEAAVEADVVTAQAQKLVAEHREREKDTE